MIIKVRLEINNDLNFLAKSMKLMAVWLATILVLILTYAQSKSIIAIKGGTILTMTGKTIQNGIILIQGERIKAVGENVKIPRGAKVVNASGKYIMPGIVDAMTYYGIRPFDLNDTSHPVTPQNRIIQAFYPFGDFMRGKGGISPDREILSGGVTTVYIAPGDRQVIGGQGAVVKTYGKSFDGLILREPAAIDITIGDPPKMAFEENKSPVTRMSIAALLRKNLIKAQEYDRSLSSYANESEEEKKKVQKPKRDLNLEALIRLLHKDIPARVEADLVDDIRTAIRISDEFDFNLIIDSGIGAYKIKNLLAKKKIPVILGPISHPFITGDEVNSAPELMSLMDERNAAQLSKAGAKIAIASYGMGSSRLGRAIQGKLLLLEAGLATGFGLPDEEALKAVTIYPAEILGVDDRVGSIEPDKDADIIILDGPPLKIKTWVEMVFMNGELVYTKGD